MRSAAEARAFKRELGVLFAAHAKQHDAAAARADFEWPGEPTPAALAIAKKYGTTWREPMVWGEDELTGDEPSVAALENKVVVFHDFCSGGLSDDLARLMAKRSGKRVAVDASTPVLFGEVALDAKGKLARELAAMFAQRETVEYLNDWKTPKWAKGIRMLGDSEQASFTIDGAICRFTLPLAPSLADAFEAHLRAAGAKIRTWRLATTDDIDNNQAREPATKASSAPTPAPRPVAIKIPRTAPVATIVRAGSPVGFGDNDACFHAIASTGKQLCFVSGRALTRWTGKRLDKLATNETGLKGLTATTDEMWACGYGYVLHSTDGGKRFRKLKLLEDKRSPRPEDSPQLLDIARDEHGVWVVGFGCTVLHSRDGKTFERLAPLDKVTINRCVPSPFGLLLLKDNGRLQIARDGKLHQTTLRARSPLYGACVTSTGAIVVVGHGDWDGAAFRSIDGATFTPSKLAVKSAPLYGVIAMADGRLLAGGHEDLLMVSYDDGKSFQKLPHKLPAVGRNYGLFCHHDGAVYGTGMFQHLVRFT
jgi:hypothetical protein